MKVALFKENPSTDRKNEKGVPKKREAKWILHPP
jgi:hypothetical protein